MSSVPDQTHCANICVSRCKTESDSCKCSKLYVRMWNKVKSTVLHILHSMHSITYIYYIPYYTAWWFTWIVCDDDLPGCEVWETVTTCGVGGLFCETGSLVILLFVCRMGVINLDGLPVTIVAWTGLPWLVGVISRGCCPVYTADGGLETLLTCGGGCLCAYTTDVVLGGHWGLEIGVLLLEYFYFYCIVFAFLL